jgi:glyoxylase-like metal-dependent hydrolase (beta-lactamase superfamily II)
MKLKKSVIVILSSIFLLSTANSQEQAEMPIEVRKLSENAIVLKLGYLQTISLATSKGIVVIDTNRGQSAGAEIRRKIAEEFGRNDFAYVINTHYHYDHTGGNKAFADLEIIGHERCLQGLRKNEARDFMPNAKRYREIAAEFRKKLQTLPPDSEEAKNIPGTMAYLLSTADDFEKGFKSLPPSITFNERMTLNLGNMTLKLRYFGNAHSDTDILIFIPEEKILLMGDIYSPARIPNFPENTQLEVPLWIANLNAFLSDECDIKHVISGHTNSDMTIEDWKDRRDYVETLWNGVTAAHKEGLTLEEIQTRFALKKSFPKFMNVKHEWGGKNIHEHNVKMIWMQLDKMKKEFPNLEGPYLGQEPPGQ